MNPFHFNVLKNNNKKEKEKTLKTPLALSHIVGKKNIKFSCLLTVIKKRHACIALIPTYKLRETELKCLLVVRTCGFYSYQFHYHLHHNSIGHSKNFYRKTKQWVGQSYNKWRRYFLPVLLLLLSNQIWGPLALLLLQPCMYHHSLSSMHFSA